MTVPAKHIPFLCYTAIFFIYFLFALRRSRKQQSVGVVF